MGDRLPKLVAALAVALGVTAVLAGASVFVEAWQTSRAWAGTAEAQHAAVPGEEPIWLDGPAPVASSLPSALPASAAPQHAPVSRALAPQPHADRPRLRAPDRDEAAARASTSAPPPPAPAESSAAPAPPVVEAAPAVAAPADVELAEVDFRFLDPPEPGAHARLAVSILNRATVPTGPLSVVVPARWLKEFQVFGAIPGVLDDRARGDDERQFVFGGLAPGERLTVELHVLATAEEVEAPDVRLLLGDDREIGRVRPRTVAPRPRPGPARAVSIPKLGVKASVVPVPWEPPPFVVGQLQGTAAVSEGNTVLIGHLAGPLGDVFARLDRLRLGDEVVAVSRGLEYRFVVSEVAVKPHDDVVPTQQTATPRLTLMTCTGQWSITRQDYSHRLWVVAEPPELAQQTIKANAERTAQAAREAEAAAAARATHEAELAAASGATQAPEDTEATAAPMPQVAAAAPPPPTPIPAATPAPGPAEPVAAAPPASGAAAPPRHAPGEAAPSEAAPAEAAPDAAEDLAPGLLIESPADRATVARRVAVRGRRTREADPRAPLWLLVRAAVEGSRWYALDRPLEPTRDGTWQLEVELGGAPGIRHEIRVGAADAAADRAFRRHAVERRGQPLDDLPEGFKTGARVVVERR